MICFQLRLSDCRMGEDITSANVKATVYSLSYQQKQALFKKFKNTNPTKEDIKLFVTRVDEPHIDIARIESFAWTEPSAERKRAQLEDLIRRARRIGGEAVVDIREYKNIVQGMIEDEVTPFPSPTQETTERTFYRGVVIRYVDTQEEALQWSSEIYESEEDPLQGRTFGRRTEPITDTTQGPQGLNPAEL